MRGVKLQRCGGFTAVELLVAVSIGMLVLIGMLAVFLWTMRATAQCRQYAWAQTESIKSSQRMVSYLRSAVAITNLDVSGNWVEVVMPPSNRVARFAYVNPGEVVGAGRLVFVADTYNSSPTNVIARGVTKVVTLPVRNVFEQAGTNALRIAYRITKPSESGAFPAEIDVGVRLRNQ